MDDNNEEHIKKHANGIQKYETYPFRLIQIFLTQERRDSTKRYKEAFGAEKQR